MAEGAGPGEGWRAVAGPVGSVMAASVGKDRAAGCGVAAPLAAAGRGAVPGRSPACAALARGLRGVAARLCLVLALLLAGLAAAPAPVHAQAASGTANGRPALDYTQWERQAGVAEALLDSGNASDSWLTDLRTQMVRWREDFQSAQNPNSARVSVLKGQIDALGPAPAEGETEASELAARRTELTNALAQEQAPALRAAEAFNRADSIIQQIDLQLRERKASALMHLSPSPLLPSGWAAAFSEAGTWARAAGAELRQRAAALPAGYLRTTLPQVALLLVLAGLALGLSAGWALGLPERLGARASRNAREAVAFLTSLLQILLPYAGVRLAVAAADASLLVGSHFRPLLEALAPAALVCLIGRWVVVSLFPLDPAAPVRLRLNEAGIRRVRRYGTALAMALGVFTAATPSILPLGGLRTLTDTAAMPSQPFTEAAAAVWHLPLLLLAAALLFRLGMVLRRSAAGQRTDAIAYRYRVAAVVGEVSRAIALVAPVLALFGYVAAANSLLWPWLDTLGLMGVVLLAQKFIDDLWILGKGGEERAQKALAPVLIGFALVLAALPVLAMIWGARASDLAEAWMQVRGGLKVGGITISPMAMLTFLVVFTAVYLATRMVQAAFSASILPKTRLDPGAQNAVVAGLGYVGIFLAALMAITSAGIDLSSFAIVAGALSVGIGFGLQNIVSNFVSGIILLIERPVAVGDWIQVGDQQGTVRRISVRSTVIQTFDRADVIVPNSDLISGTVTNITRGNLQGRVIVTVTVSFDTDTRAVESLLQAIAEDQPQVLVNPPPVVIFSDFGANGLQFELRVILADVNQGIVVGSDIRHQIVRRFREAGIDIPGSTHAVWLRGVDGKPQPPVPEADVVAVAPDAGAGKGEDKGDGKGGG